MNKKKNLLLSACIAVLVVLMAALWPFRMEIYGYACEYQQIAAVHGENMPLREAMSRVDEAESKISQWNIIDTSTEYASLTEIAHNADASQAGEFTLRLILLGAALVMLIVCVALVKKLSVLLLALGGIVMVFPFYWMIASSFKTASEMNVFPPSMLPESWLNTENYVTAWDKAPFAKYFFNSIFVCICSVAVVMFTSILAAFAFSRLQFPGRDVLFTLLLSMMMVPFELLVITNFQTITRLGMRDTLAGLILPFTSSIFYTYILRNFFASVPDSLYYSSRVDGASNWQYLWKVMVPIARPSLVTILLLNAMASWNSFMWPKLVVSRDEVRTLPWALITFTTEVGSNNELIMAGATRVVLPMLVFFLFARKQIVRGVARGGIKG